MATNIAAVSTSQRSSTQTTVTVDLVSDLIGARRKYGAEVTTIIVLGYHETNDGGGGIFVYNNKLTDINDGGLVFNGWERTHSNGAINVRWFGARGNGGDLENKSLQKSNTKALAFNKRKMRLTKNNRPGIVTTESISGVFIPSGEYILGEEALFSSEFKGVVSGINFYSDGNAILSVTHQGADNYLFNNQNRGSFFTFRNITFLGYSDDTHLFYSHSMGQAQDYYFDRCSFKGRFGRIMTIRGDGSKGDTNSEWGFNKCAFSCYAETVLDVKDSDQFLNYWFDQTKFWLKGNSKTLVANNGGHFKFINCDWSGIKPDRETYLFELMGARHEGVMDFRIINGRFEMKSQQARVLKTDWKTGNIEITADFGSQLFSQGYNMKHFDFDIQDNSSLNVSFKNSVMMGYHEFRYKNESYKGTGRATYENCSFPNRCELDGFVKIDFSEKNRSGISMISIEDAIMQDIDLYNLQVTSVDFLPLQSNRGLKRKYHKISNPATGTNPTDGLELHLNFPEEAESVITGITWRVPSKIFEKNGRFWLSDMNGKVLSELQGNFRRGLWKEENVYLKLTELPEGKIILKSDGVQQETTDFVCIIEYF